MTSFADPDRIAIAVDQWKRRLLDLSKRNRALNFKMNRVSTVAVVDELPGHVFRKLVLREGAMRFRAVLPEPALGGRGGEQTAPAGEPETADPAFETGDLDDGIVLPAVREEKLDPNRHYDDVLQAHATPSALDRSLRRLAEQGLAGMEEQGVNTLYLALGMLLYRDPQEPDRELRAPVLLLPVRLSRRAAGTGFTVRAAEDDPVVNPALAEYLRRTVDLVLPALPDSAAMPEDYDLQVLLDEVAALVAGRPGWSVRPDIYLGLFSFQKLVMYRDLEAHADHFRDHRLIRQIVTRTGEAIAGLPDEVERMDLDEVFPPETTAQVVDADASQLRAIAAVARGYDLVLEGPPGTGKSQTITNLIGQALADGKTVLFVAEKMAALEVVHRRLVEAGLGAFCLELHSTKANKRQVLGSIRTALDASLQVPEVSTAAAERLPDLRRVLNDYAETVHRPDDALGLSPYAAYGELAAVLHAPKVRLTGRIDDVTLRQVAETVEALQVLHHEVAEIGDPNAHPWRDTERTFYAVSDQDAVKDLLDELAALLAEIRDLAGDAARGFGLPAIRTPQDVRTAAVVAALLERSPGAPPAVLASEAWNVPPPQAVDLVRRGRALAALRLYVEARMRPEAVETDHTADVAFFEQKEASFFRLFNPLNGRYRLLRNRWKALRLPGYAPTWAEQVEDLKQVDRLRRERMALQAADHEARDLFGRLWKGEASDWEALEAYIRWVVDFRAACVRHGLREQAAHVAERPAPDTALLHRLDAAAARAARALDFLRERVRWPEGYLAEAPFDEVEERLAAMAGTMDRAPRWAAYVVARKRVEESPAAELLPQALRGDVAFADLPDAFRRAFYQRWLDQVVERRPLLRQFHTLAHEQRVEEFRKLDRQILLDNRQVLVGRLRDRTQALLREADVSAGLGFLRNQINRQRGHAPLRRTLREAGAAIRAVKPCFLMSPLTVAQLLEDVDRPFDLVLFDEASQLTAEDAAGAIARGRQLVVVGDPKQLPPTNFFAVMSGQVTTEVDEAGDPVVEETESVLEECLGAGLPHTRLKWHYRSLEESLISFSNAAFYESDLYTFPSVHTDAHRRGLAFEYVANGVYEGKGLNPEEARRVADAVVRHARTSPKRSLGVGTFNLRQQIAILDELELRRRQDPDLESFFSGHHLEPFFVKNLENIQGDERDVIFLSVTYAKGRDGVLRHNFGPINGENGGRRLNVITTRARQHMRVFSSMRGDEIDLSKTSATGARLLRDFLLYAERGRLDGSTAVDILQAESTFESAVYAELTSRGLVLQPQVGVAGYRIDFGVIDETVPGRFVCGIECDGPAYYRAASARDRDRLRRQVLESRGWTLFRVWSTDWFKDRPGEVDRLLARVAASRRDAHEALARRAAAHKAEHVWESIPDTPEVDGVHGPAPTGETPGGSHPVTSTGLPDDPAPALSEAAPYRFAELKVRPTDTPFPEIPVVDLLPAIRTIVETEAPLHVRDLAARLADAYGLARVSARIEEHIHAACAVAAGKHLLRRRGDFIWDLSDEVAVRSRAGAGIPAERIAPEEYRAAVRTVLTRDGAVDRKTLVNEVRTLFGFTRTGPQLEQAIQTVIDDLLASNTLGEGGLGLALRE